MDLYHQCFHQKLNGTESQQTPIIDTQVYRSRLVDPVGDILECLNLTHHYMLYLPTFTIKNQAIHVCKIYHRLMV